VMEKKRVGGWEQKLKIKIIKTKVKISTTK
jgi:hypothetical protein